MIYTIAHNKGGVGKSTVAMQLAVALKPDVIVDQDTHQSLIIINQLRDHPLNVVTCHTRSDLINILKLSDDGKNILIDCGGFDSDINRLAVAAADIVIVPANDDVTERIGLRSFENVLADISNEMDKHVIAHVLFNRVHPNRKNFQEVEEFLAEAQHMTRLTTVIPRRKEYPKALADGLSVIEHKATKWGAASRDITALVDELNTL